MTNYNERIDEIINNLSGKYSGSIASAMLAGGHPEETIFMMNKYGKEAKQAIIKLIEDEVREAVWKEKERIYEFATRKQANGLYVPIELGIEPWLREQL